MRGQLGMLGCFLDAPQILSVEDSAPCSKRHRRHARNQSSSCCKAFAREGNPCGSLQLACLRVTHSRKKPRERTHKSRRSFLQRHAPQSFPALYFGRAPSPKAEGSPTYALSYRSLPLASYRVTHPLSNSFLLFRIAGQTYAVAVEAVEEVLSMAKLETPQGAPGALLGFLELSGSPVAVISLRRLFELPQPEPSYHTPLIILKGDRLPLAICVDEVCDIVRVAPENILAVSESCSINDCLTGILRLPTGRALLLASDRLLLEEERIRLADLQSRQQERLEDSCEVVH